jgi:serine protease Do
MSAIAEASELIGSAAQTAGPAVVGLGGGWRGGTGVVVADGRVLTAAHNLRGRRRHAEPTVSVVFADGRREDAEILGVDREFDLAVLSVDTGGITPIEPASADGLGLGTPVVALARPGGRALRVTHGFVSTDQREVRGPRGRRIPALEHTAPLPRGSSGGPLLDAEGRLVGINVIRLDGGLIVAVDTVALTNEVERLGRGEASTRRRLGVAVAPPHVARRMRRAVGLPDATGILVRAVEDGSPADSAGVERGDLLVELNGKPLERIDDLYTALDAPAESIELKLLRGSDERSVTVSFAAAS